MTTQVPPLDFLGSLRWLDGRPLLATLEPYRHALLHDGLYALTPDGRQRYDMVLSGRAKKNGKTTDLVLAALYKLLVWQSPQGNQCFLVANDEDQAGDDLDLATKLIRANPMLDHEVLIRGTWIERRDGRGRLEVLPARDVVGAHGKTYLFAGFDEIHGYRSWDLFEALAPDPTRPDVLTWVTSYAAIHRTKGAPLQDLYERGKAGTDPRMLFSWYSADFTTDPELAGDEVPPESRANPSMGAWADAGYLATQRARLPTHKFRRLHLNLPGALTGAFLDADKVLACVVPGRRKLPREPATRYTAFVDMSGGSSDDAVLAIGHFDEARGLSIVDLVECQAGKAPFSPTAAVEKFARLLKAWGVSRVMGDAYAGMTFRGEFQKNGIAYTVCPKHTSPLYDELEPKINAGEVELLDDPRAVEQLCGLITKGAKHDHAAGEHDDFATAVAGLVYQLASKPPRGPQMFHALTGKPIEAEEDDPLGIFQRR